MKERHWTLMDISPGSPQGQSLLRGILPDVSNPPGCGGGSDIGGARPGSAMPRSLLTLLLLALTLHCSPAAAATPIDWTTAGDEAATVLSSYLQVDTVNPQGHEDRAVDFLGTLLDREGIPWTEYTFRPGRSSLVARLKGSVPMRSDSSTDSIDQRTGMRPA